MSFLGGLVGGLLGKSKSAPQQPVPETYVPNYMPLGSIQGFINSEAAQEQERLLLGEALRDMYAPASDAERSRMDAIYKPMLQQARGDSMRRGMYRSGAHDVTRGKIFEQKGRSMNEMLENKRRSGISALSNILANKRNLSGSVMDQFRNWESMRSNATSASATNVMANNAQQQAFNAQNQASQANMWANLGGLFDDITGSSNRRPIDNAAMSPR